MWLVAAHAGGWQFMQVLAAAAAALVFRGHGLVSDGIQFGPGRPYGVRVQASDRQ